MLIGCRLVLVIRRCDRFGASGLFGHAEQGLQAPVTATGTMFTVKTSYADYGHHGEMAWQQMYVVQ